MIPKFESIPGPFNGVTTDFTTTAGFTEGSLQVWKNERLLSPEAANGWSELVPAAGSFRMKQAPEVGDQLRVFYLDRTRGVVYLQADVGEFSAEYEDDVDFQAELDDDAIIEAVLEDDLA